MNFFSLLSDNTYWCRWPRLPRDPACYQSCAHGGVPAALPAEGAEAGTAPEEHPWLCSLKTVAKLDPAFPSRHRCGVTILSGQPAMSVQEAEPQVLGAGRQCWWAPPSATWCAGARRGRPWTCAAADRCHHGPLCQITVCWETRKIVKSKSHSIKDIKQGVIASTSGGIRDPHLLPPEGGLGPCRV